MKAPKLVQNHAHAPVRRPPHRRFWMFHGIPLVFVLPAVVLFILFFLGPASLGFYYSLTDYRGVGSADWVGLDNYARLFTDDQFYRALTRTFLFTALVVPINYVIALGVSVLLVSPWTKGSNLARTVFFIPWLVSPIVTGVIWRWLFGENFGVVNYLLSLLGLGTYRWQTDANFSLSVVILAGVWGGTAFSMLLFMAALRNIPQSYYEAAELDGAGPWRRLFYITLPLLRPTSFMVILLSTIGAMKEFAMIQALNGGGPGTSNYLMVQYIYSTGFERARIGYASAASIVLMVILVVIALLQMLIDKRAEYGDA